MKLKVICIDDSMRPNELPLSRWVKRGNIYHIVEIAQMAQQSGVMGCKLAEINNDDYFPYQYFRLSRFALVAPEKIEENVKKEELVEA